MKTRLPRGDYPAVHADCHLAKGNHRGPTFKPQKLLNRRLAEPPVEYATPPLTQKRYTTLTLTETTPLGLLNRHLNTDRKHS